MDISAIAAAGLDVAQSRFEKAATGVTSPDNGAVGTTPVDTVSLSQQAVGLLSAKNELSASLRVVHAVDQMQKSLLNLLGSL